MERRRIGDLEVSVVGLGGNNFGLRVPEVERTRTVVDAALANGVNLIDGSTNQITALASSDGSKRITTSAEDMSLGGSVVSVASTSTISSQTAASTMISTIIGSSATQP